MKYLIIIPFLFLACTNSVNQKMAGVIHFDTGFSLYQDTIYVDIKGGDLTHALKYQDNYYLLFNKYYGDGEKWLYFFNNENLIKVDNFYKKDIYGYFDFFVKNDSMIIKPHMDGQCYYFNTNNSIWEQIEKVDDLIFEDEHFYVYSLDFGEFGGVIIWFKEKKTGIEYTIRATASFPLVNKINTTYYLTNAFSVMKIENPLKLNKCDTDANYENIETSNGYYFEDIKSIGFDFVYRDTIGEYSGYFGYPYIPYHPSIISSFVWQNKLLYIYETDTVTYVAKIEDGSVKPIQAIAKELRFYKNGESYRCRNLNGNNELLQFKTKDDQLFGLMEIVDNKIFMHYFANQAEFSLGAEKANSIFVNRLNLILSDLDSLQIKDIDIAENNWEIFDITPNYNIGIRGWNSDKYTIDTCKLYLIQEDSLISNTITYFGTKSNGLVRTVFFEWDYTDKEFVRRNKLEDTVQDILKRKLIFLENCISQKVGNPILDEKNNQKIWKTSNGLKIELGNSTNIDRIRFRLIIYKQ